MEEVELKIKSQQLKTYYKIKIENVYKTIKDIKEELGKQIKVGVEDIELIFCTQTLKNDKMLKEYEIQNGVTIFSIFKEPKNIKTVPQLVVNTNKRNTKKKNDDNNINNENNNNDNKDNIEDSPNIEFDNINLKIYSSIIKILAYKNDDNNENAEDIMKLIMKNLKEKYDMIYQEIRAHKEYFIKLLKKDIKKEDIEIYKQNIIIAKNLIEKQKEENDDKFDINITNSEREYIMTWERKGLEKETIILEYVKNKFDEDKTNKSLMKILSEKNI